MYSFVCPFAPRRLLPLPEASCQALRFALVVWPCDSNSTLPASSLVLKPSCAEDLCSLQQPGLRPHRLFGFFGLLLDFSSLSSFLRWLEMPSRPSCLTKTNCHVGSAAGDASCLGKTVAGAYSSFLRKSIRSSCDLCYDACLYYELHARSP